MKRLLCSLIVLLLTATTTQAGTRAVQVESLMAGMRDASGKLLTGGKVYIYAAGTTTPATVWTDANKTTPAANPVVLDAAGKAQVFADGLYKFVLQTSTGAAVATLDNLKYRYANVSVLTKISSYAATLDDDVILANAASAGLTITLPDATKAAYPLIVKKIDATGNAVTIAASGGQTIDGNATIAIAVQNGTATLYSDGSQWRGATTVVVAGDSDKLDGYHAANTSGAVPISNGTVNTNLNADLLDGQHGAYYQNADNLNAGTVALARIPATLTGKDADTLDSYHAAALITLTAPPGAVTAFAGATVPGGWLECNGAAVSRTTYAALFAAIGTIYGTGDGSTTFNLPDLRGEFIRGYDHGKNTDIGRGLGTAQSDDFKAHTHTVTNSWANGSDPTTTYKGWQGTNRTSGDYSVTTASAGGTETRPRNIAMMYIIKQ